MEGCRHNNNSNNSNNNNNNSNNNNKNRKLGPSPLGLSSLTCPLPSPSLCGLWCNGYPAVVSESSRRSEDEVLLSRQNGGRRAVPRCHVDGCRSDLSSAREYQRRHKVCELHSKAITVRIAGTDQRFCQQCSRFHALSEFDDTKRSCRKRLARHNERRRKSLNTASSSSSSSSTTAAAAAAAMARDGYYNLQMALSMSPVHFLHGHGHSHSHNHGHGEGLLLKGKGLTEQYQHHHHHHHDHHGHHNDHDDDDHHISNMIGRALSLLSSDVDTWHSHMKKENDDLLAQMLGLAHHPTYTHTLP